MNISPNAAASTASRPASVTIAIRPCPARMRRCCDRTIERELVYFCAQLVSSRCWFSSWLVHTRIVVAGFIAHDSLPQFWELESRLRWHHQQRTSISGITPKPDMRRICQNRLNDQSSHQRRNYKQKPMGSLLSGNVSDQYRATTGPPNL